jgi:hypothetical protein
VSKIGDVVGLLDITKCLYEALEKLEKAHKSSKQLADALQGMQNEWAQPANPGLQNYISIVSDRYEPPWNQPSTPPLAILRLTMSLFFWY